MYVLASTSRYFLLTSVLRIPRSRRCVVLWIPYHGIIYQLSCGRGPEEVVIPTEPRTAVVGFGTGTAAGVGSGSGGRRVDRMVDRDRIV